MTMLDLSNKKLQLCLQDKITTHTITPEDVEIAFDHWQPAWKQLLTMPANDVRYEPTMFDESGFRILGLRAAQLLEPTKTLHHFRVRIKSGKKSVQENAGQMSALLDKLEVQYLIFNGEHDRPEFWAIIPKNQLNDFQYYAKDVSCTMAEVSALVSPFNPRFTLDS
jgi:hypothetical protein